MENGIKGKFIIGAKNLKLLKCSLFMNFLKTSHMCIYIHMYAYISTHMDIKRDEIIKHIF